MTSRAEAIEKAATAVSELYSQSVPTHYTETKARLERFEALRAALALPKEGQAMTSRAEAIARAVVKGANALDYAVEWMDNASERKALKSMTHDAAEALRAVLAIPKEETEVERVELGIQSISELTGREWYKTDGWKFYAERPRPKPKPTPSPGGRSLAERLRKEAESWLHSPDAGPGTYVGRLMHEAADRLEEVEGK